MTDQTDLHEGEGEDEDPCGVPADLVELHQLLELAAAADDDELHR